MAGKPEGKRTLGIPRWRQVDNIKMDLAEMGLNGEGRIGMAKDRDKWRAGVNMAMNLWIL
jgi:hypothetical protein